MIMIKEVWSNSEIAYRDKDPGADLGQMLTDFLNQPKRRKFLEVSGACFPGKLFGF